MTIELLILLLISCLSFVLILKNFNIAVYVLLLLSVLLHKELFSFYAWDFLPVRFFMLAFAAATSFKLLQEIIQAKSIKPVITQLKDPFIFLLIALLLIKAASIFFTRNLSASLFMLVFFVTAVLLGFALFKHLFGKEQAILKYIKFYIVIGFILCVFGFFQTVLYLKTEVIIGALWNVPGNLPRVGATFWDVNHFAALLSVLLTLLGAFIVLPLVHSGKKDLVKQFVKQRAGYVVMFVPMLAILLLTNSRTAWISAAVSFIAFVSLLFVRKFGSKGVLIIAAVILVISAVGLREYSIKSSPFRAVVKQYFHYRMDSFDSHMLLLTGAFQIFERYPILGGGIGSFYEQFSKMPVSAEFFGRDPAALNTRVPPHTIWGELVAETGILGLVVFTLMVGLIFMVLLYVALRSKDTNQVLIASGMFSSILGLMVAGVFYSYNAEFFWIILFLFFLYGASALGRDYKVATLLNYFVYKTPMPIILVALITFGLLFINLGGNHLIPWDEAIYAKISKNMVVTGEYTTQYWLGTTPWYEKPPLYMWLMAFLMNMGGFTSLMARLPSAFFGFGGIILAYLLGKKLVNKTAGLFAAFALGTTTQYLYYARTSMLDVTSAFFIALALYLYLLAREKNKIILWLAGGLAIGLSVMTKGVIGLFPFGIIAVYEFYQLLVERKNYPFKIIVKLVLMGLVAFLVFMPWHIEMFKRFGDAFIQKYLLYHVFDRALQDIEDKGRPFWWYLIVLKVSMRTWFVVLMAAFPYALANLLPTEKLAKLLKVKDVQKLASLKLAASSKHLVFLLIWIGLVFLMFSAATSKLVWYIIPIYLPLCIVIGAFIAKVLELKYFNNVVLKSLLVILIIFGQLFYLFLNKNLVYTSDLTGSQALLLQTKDKKFGVATPVLLDKIELPLAAFYTDGPFELVEFSQLREKAKNRAPDTGVFFIDKESRLRKLQELYGGIIFNDQIKEWQIGYILSQKEMTAGLK